MKTTPVTPPPQNLAEAKLRHTKIEFEPFSPSEPDKLCVGIFGRPGTGKTRLLASAPGLGVIPLQRKTRPTVEQVQRELGIKRILWPKNETDFHKYKNPMEVAMMDREQSKTYYRLLVNRIKDAAWSLLEHPDCRSIGIDSGYNLYQTIVAAHYGKASQLGDDKTLWGPPNDEFREFVVTIQNKHLIITTEAKEAYKGKVALGHDEPAGYKQLGYDANVLVETAYSIEDGFSLNVRMCQDRAALMGEEGQQLLRDDMITFQALAMCIRPDSKDKDWE